MYFLGNTSLALALRTINQSNLKGLEEDFPFYTNHSDPYYCGFE